MTKVVMGLPRKTTQAAPGLRMPALRTQLYPSGVRGNLKVAGGRGVAPRSLGSEPSVMLIYQSPIVRYLIASDNWHCSQQRKMAVPSGLSPESQRFKGARN